MTTTVMRAAWLAALLLAAACAGPRQAAYATPEAAVAALADMLENPDLAGAEALFGTDGVELIRTGDDVADREDGLAALAAIREAVAFEPDDAGRLVPQLGHDRWPFPIPLAGTPDGWRFDAQAGVDELANRRVGRNELLTLACLHACVDAQREYFAAGVAGEPAAYAARFLSRPGARDGLYWPADEGAAQSPLGPLVAAAAHEGYTDADLAAVPFHGYHYRMLDAQGAHAPGGERAYRDEQGRLTGGFAVLAWPAKHGVSGVMSFLVNGQGVVFEKDLGEDTASAAAAIEAYDPDRSWTPTPD